MKLNKASQYSDIPTKIIKENLDIFSNFNCESIKNSIKSSIFPSCLKHADVTPLHKKCNKSLKENYKPVSILPILSKVFADVTPLHKKCNKSLKENYRPGSILPILSKVFKKSFFK